MKFLKQYTWKTFLITTCYVIIIFMLFSFFLLALTNTLSKITSYESLLVDDIRPSITQTGELDQAQISELTTFMVLLKYIVKQLLLLAILYLAIQALLRSLRDTFIWKLINKQKVSTRKKSLISLSLIFLAYFMTTLAIIFFVLLHNVLISILLALFFIIIYEVVAYLLEGLFFTNKPVRQLLGKGVLQSSISFLILIIGLIIYTLLIVLLLGKIIWFSTLLLFLGYVVLTSIRMTYLYWRLAK